MEPGQASTVLYVTNIHHEVKEDDLYILFGNVGKVNRVSFPPDCAEKLVRYGTLAAFITMDNASDAEAAVNALDGLSVEGRPLSVRIKLSKEELQRRREQLTGPRKDNRQRKPMKTEERNNMLAPDHGAAHANGMPYTSEGLRTPGYLDVQGNLLGETTPLSITVQRDKEGGRVQHTGSLRKLQTFEPGRGIAASVTRRDDGLDYCGNCGKAASLRCKACKMTYYCNATCMQNHWPVHRKICVYDQRMTAVDPGIGVFVSPSQMPVPDSSIKELRTSNTVFINNNKENMSDIMPASANSASVRQQSLQHQYLHAGQRNKLWEQFETTTHVFRPTQNQAPPVSSGKQERPSKKLPANRPGPGQTESLQPDRDHHTRPVSAGDHSTQPGGPAVSGQGVKSGRAPAKRNYVGEESVGSRGLPKPENTDMQTSGSGDMALSQPSKMGQARARGKGQRNQLWTNQKERSGAGKEAQQGQTVLQQKNMGAGAGVGSGGRFDDDERKGPSQQQRSDGLGFQQSQKQAKGKKGEGRASAAPDPKTPGQDSQQERTTVVPPQMKAVTAERLRDPVPSSGGNSKASSVDGSIQQQHGAAAKLPPCSPADLLQLGKPMDVLVCHIESPESFWVQVVEQMTAVWPTLNHILATRPPKQKRPSIIRRGDIFLCEYQGELSRARVVNVTEGSVRIQYVDFGNCEETQRSKLFRLPAELIDWPPLSVHCSLLVTPASNRGWPAEAVRELQELFGESEIAILTVVKVPLSVAKGTLVRKRDGLDATKFVLEKGYGIRRAGEPALPFSPTQRVMASSISSSMDQLRVGQRVDVVLLDTAGPMDMRVRIHNLDKAFSDFSIGMSEHYDSAFSTGAVYIPMVGELVVARFSFDKTWCRAEVLAVFPEKGMASLFYIDYGNQEQLPFQELRAVEPEFAAMPIQSISCAIGGIHIPDNGQWNEEHFGVFMTCLYKFITEEDKLKFTIIVESIKEKVVWVSVVRDQLQQTLSDILTEQLEVAFLPQPLLPQPVPSTTADVGGGTSVPAGEAPSTISLSPSMPGLEESSPKQNKSTREEEVLVSDQVTTSLLMLATDHVIGESSQHSPASSLPDMEETSPKVTETATITRKSGSVASPPLKTLSEKVPAVSGGPPQENQLRRATLPHEGQVVCGILEIVSCQEFYVIQKEGEEELNQLQASLSCYCDSAAAQTCRTVSCGALVLAQFSVDLQWYRGSVTKVSPDGASCTVFFIDYGNAEDKPVSSLRILPPQFLALPSQAVCCKLAGVPPPVSEEVEGKFRAACLQTVKLKVMGRQDDKYFVQIFTMGDVSIVEVLGIQSARKRSSRGQRTVSKVGDGSLSQGPTSQPLGICVADATSSSRDQHPPVVHPPHLHSSSAPPVVLGDADGAVEGRLTRSCLWVAVADDEAMDNVMVTHVVNPSCFYAVDSHNFVSQHKDGGLVSKLQALGASTPLDSLPQVGDILCGIFEGQWFRCEVLETVSGMVRVNFFDYGNEAVLDLSDLRFLPKEFCDSFPLATFKCALHGVTPAGDSWDEETVQLSKQLLENQLVGLEVRTVCGDVRHVEVTSRATGDNIGQILLDSSRALPL